MFPAVEPMRAELRQTGKITIAPGLSFPPPFLKVKAAGICRTDRKARRSPPSSMNLPRVLGHEVCGLLSREVCGFAKGSRVALWPALSCGTCDFCTSGRENLCPEIQLFGCHLDGGFASVISLPENLLNHLVCLELPTSLRFKEAVFAEPLGCVVHAFKKAGDNSPGSLLIMGGGLMGRLAARTAAAIWPECRTTIFDNSRERLKNCRNEGGMETPDSADLVFIAASARDALYWGLQRLAPGGTIILFSGFAKEEREITIDHNLLHRREQHLVGAYGCCPDDMAEALELMAARKIQVTDLISRKISLAELDPELARDPGPDDYKTIITP